MTGRKLVVVGTLVAIGCGLAIGCESPPEARARHGTPIDGVANSEASRN